ncbi:DUF3553 domain-containing protein [Pseudomonadota bacterium]
MANKHEIGEYVVNPNKPDWGPGIVLDVSGSVVTVYFRDALKRPVRKIDTSIVELQPASISSDPVLDNLPPYDSASKQLKKKRVTHQDGIEMFRSYYPLLFDDPTYFGDRTQGERAYKLEAHDAFNELLGNGIGRALLDKDDIAEIQKRLFTVEGLLNLLSPYEKMALKDGLNNETAARSYFSALFDVIEKDGVDKETYQSLIEAVNLLPHEVGKARVATWPVLTQFPYIARPDCHMLLKPEVTQACAERKMFNLNYKPALNWVTYSQLIKLANMLFEELKPMGAKDFIDVQSYIWIIGYYQGDIN